MLFSRQLRNRFLDAWQSLIGKTKQECITLYLCLAKNWATFGAKLFKAKVGIIRPIQTSNFLCDEPNVNDLKSSFELICIRFGT